MAKLSGLTSAEAKKRLSQHGPNVLPGKKPTSIWVLLARQFQSPLIYILVIAAVVSMVLQEYSDSIIIALAVVINTILGFYQEHKAEKSLLALKKILSQQARVIRDGVQQTIDAADLVVGDIVVLTAGDRIPADGVVHAAHTLFANEAILTGESVPVAKQALTETQTSAAFEKLPKDAQVFMGTAVTTGTGTIRVAKTGLDTQIGSIATRLAGEEEEQTPLQRKLAAFAKFLTVLVGVGSLVVFVAGVLSGRSVFVMFETSVAVAVAAIPEGMVVALTVILALGMQRILKRRALVRRLVAAETLGSVTVIATDKTGTLTEGQLRVVRVASRDTKQAVSVATYANQLLDPLEVGLWEWVKKQGRDPQQLREKRTPVHVVPFHPKQKFSATVYADETVYLGAPEVLLAHTTLSHQEKQKTQETIEAWAAVGLRLIGMARKSHKTGTHTAVQLDRLEWVGLVGFEDPVRESVADALHQATRAGIAIKIITGDYRRTAEAVLKKLDISVDDHAEEILDGEEIEQLSDAKLRTKVAQVRLFARTTPDQKFRIISALQDNGEVVALVGDGVNDAPAIKRSDIGIVVAEASDVARETADMVLLDSNFATIMAAVEEGRGIYDNIRKVVLYLVSSSFSEMVMVFGSVLLGLPLPMTAAQILWLNIVTDGFPHLALTVDPKAHDLLSRTPTPRDRAIIDWQMRSLVVIISGISGIVSLASFVVARALTGDVVFARTVAFTTLATASLLYVFSVRNLEKPLWSKNLFTNFYLIAAVVISILLQIMAVYTAVLQGLLETRSLPLVWWVVAVGAAVVVIVAIEVTKLLYNRLRD